MSIFVAVFISFFRNGLELLEYDIKHYMYASFFLLRETGSDKSGDQNAIINCNYQAIFPLFLQNV